MTYILDILESKVHKMYIYNDCWVAEELQVAQTENGYALLKETYSNVEKASVRDIEKVDEVLCNLYGTILIEKEFLFESTLLEEVQLKFDEASSFHKIAKETVDVLYYAGQTVFLRQQPYLTGTKEDAYFEASAYDINGNEIVAVWEIDNHEADEEFEMVDDWNKVSVYRKV